VPSFRSVLTCESAKVMATGEDDFAY
jgi:hypothetical protein